MLIRKNIANWIKPDTKVVDLQVVKEDRGQIYAILPYEEFLELIADDKEYRGSGMKSTMRKGNTIKKEWNKYPMKSTGWKR